MNDADNKSGTATPQRSNSIRSKLQYLLWGLMAIISIVILTLYSNVSLRALIANQNIPTPKAIEFTDITDIPVFSSQSPVTESNKSVVNKGYKHVLPRAAFLDQRKIGGHKNAVAILVHMSKEVLNKNLVVGCIVNGVRTKKFNVLSFLMNGWIHRVHPQLPYDDVVISCYDATITKTGTNDVIVEYKNPKDNKQIISIKSEEALFIPSFEPASKTHSNVMVCITAHGTPPCFSDWLHYQRTLGVDLVYINAQESFIKSAVYSDTFFQESLSSGFVQVKVWKEYLSKDEVFYHSQLLYYHNCLYRFQGIYDYAIILDTDEFYVVGDHKVNIHQHLDKLFSPGVGALRLDQVVYHAPAGGFNRTNEQIASDGNLPLYAVRTSQRTDNFKSVCKISATVELSVHTVVGMMPGFREYAVPKQTAHIAHMK